MGRGRVCPDWFRGSVATIPVATLLVVLPWVNGGRSQEGQLWLAGLSGMALLAALLSRGLPSKPRTLLAPLLFGALCWCSLLWSHCPDDTVGAALTATACLALFVVLARNAGRVPVRAWLAGGLAIGILASAALAVRQQMGGTLTPDAWLDPVFRGVIQNRVSGPTDNPNVFAGYLAYALPLCLGLAMSLPGVMGWLCSLAGGVAGGCLLLTFSRAGWLGASGGLLVILIALARRGHWAAWARLLPLCVVLAAALISYPREIGLRSTHVPRLDDGTLEHRLFMWRAGLTMLRQHPFTGVGLGCYQACFPGACPRGVMRKYALVRSPGSAHSDYVQGLSEFGLPLSLLVITLSASAVLRHRSQRPAKSRAPDVLLRAGSWGTLAAAALGGIAQSNLQTPLCGVLLALAVALLSGGESGGDAHCPANRLGRAANLAAIAIALLLPGLAVSRHTACDLREHAREDAYTRHTESALQKAALAARLSPLSPDAPCLIGDIHAALALESSGNEHLGLAESAYRVGIALDPCSGVLRCKMADVLERRGRMPAAFDSAKRACELDWYKASYHLLAARLAGELGQSEAEKAYLKTSIALFPLEISLAQERNEGGAWYATVLERAYSDAIKRYEEAFRRAPAPRPLLEGASPIHERELLARLRRCGIRAPVRHVGVGEAGTDLVASIETRACVDKGNALPASQLEADSLRALRIAFGLDSHVQHVDYCAVLTDADNPPERVVFSVAVARQRYRQAEKAHPSDGAALLACLGPVRYASKSPRDAWDGIKARYHTPAGESLERAKVRALTQAREDPGGRVALTIDDGPYPMVTPMVLAALRMHGAHATFFLVGKDAEEHPGLVLEILRGGHELACHTYSHRRLSDLEPAETYAEIRAGRDVIKTLSGSVPEFFRAPGGSPPPSGLVIAEELGLCTVFWSRNMGDWFGGALTEAAGAERQFAGGDIILAHGSSRANVRRLEQLLEDLHAQGLSATRLGDLYPPESIEAIPADRVAGQTAHLR